MNQGDFQAEGDSIPRLMLGVSASLARVRPHLEGVQRIKKCGLHINTRITDRTMCVTDNIKLQKVL